MDYDTLVGAKTLDGSIRNWTNWTPTPAEVCLAEAQAWIYRTLRVRKMLTLAAGTISASANSLDLPTGYKAALSLRRAGSMPGLIKLTEPVLFEQILATDENGDPVVGCPTVATTDGTMFLLNVTTDTTYPYRLWYYRSLPDLDDDANETNFLTDDLPDLLRYACLYRAFDHMKQWSASARNETLAKEQINLANSEWDMERQEQSFELHWEGNL